MWTDVLPDSPNAAAARAFLKALRGDLAVMRAFRLAHRTASFLASRSEEKHVERETKWLREFAKAKLEGYSIEGGWCALYLSTPDDKWYTFALELEGAKIAGITVSEVRVQQAAR